MIEDFMAVKIVETTRRHNQKPRNVNDLNQQQ
jgi:hypothetical protein